MVLVDGCCGVTPQEDKQKACLEVWAAGVCFHDWKSGIIDSIGR